MGGYFNRGASAGGHDEGYFDREDVTGPAGVGSETGGPGGVARDDIEFDAENPNIVRAVPKVRDARLDETAGVTTEQRIQDTYPDIIEGSDSERTGTSWGLPPDETAPTVNTPQGEMPEGSGPGKASPTRNEGNRSKPDPLHDIGAWGTMGEEGSAGSPTGGS